MTRVAIILFLLFLTGFTTPAYSATSKKYAEGVCDGYKAAQIASMRNRDYYRQILQLPEESHDDVIKRIYANPKAKPSGDFVDQTKQLVVDGMDLYVVLPALSERTPSLILPEGQVVNCRGKP